MMANHTNYMPFHHFRELFPDLGHMGKPKQEVLDSETSQFESYSKDNVKTLGQILIHGHKINTGKGHPMEGIDNTF